MYCDDIRDMDFESALKSLLSLFLEVIQNGFEKLDEAKCQLLDWIRSQPSFIRALISDLCCAS